MRKRGDFKVILHIATLDAWQQARTAGAYRGDTLDVEGFIHCSHPEQVAGVANSRFRGRADLILLCVDETRLVCDLREEEGEPGRLFPHIYGPLNLDAVVYAVAFPPDANGMFTLPAAVSESED
jgi:uncharacterized protein (DUF952 family)